MTGPTTRARNARSKRDAVPASEEEGELAVAERALTFSPGDRYYAPFRAAAESAGHGGGGAAAESAGHGGGGAAAESAGHGGGASTPAVPTAAPARPKQAEGDAGKPRPRERLSPAARALANRLAGHVSLVNTVRGFPHVLNRLAQDWQEPLRFYDTTKDLLIDGRGDRTGFPFVVANELTLLLEHYRRLVHPPRVDERWKGIDPR